jgi:hypothetical protein
MVVDGMASLQYRVCMNEQRQRREVKRQWML